MVGAACPALWLAASTSAQRRWGDPCLERRPRRLLSADSSTAGSRPLARTSCRDRLNRRASPISASRWHEKIGPTPKIVCSARQWGSSFANSSVRAQLAQQQIFFPSKALIANPPKGSTEITPAMKPYLLQYGGQQLLTGAQAEAYANHFIAIHLSEMPYGGVYSKISAAAMAQPKNASLKALEQTSFQGTTLRGMLLEAYGFSTFGMIAFWAGIAAFMLAALMSVLVAFGVWHARQTPAEDELLCHSARSPRDAGHSQRSSSLLHAKRLAPRPEPGRGASLSSCRGSSRITLHGFARPLAPVLRLNAANPQDRAADPRMFARARRGDPGRMLASTPATTLLASVFSLNGRPRYIHEGWFLISVANLTVIVLMIAVFCLALVAAVPARRDGRGDTVSASQLRPTWTGRLRRVGVAALPPERLLPDTQPVYVVVVDLRLRRPHAGGLRRDPRLGRRARARRARLVARLLGRALRQQHCTSGAPSCSSSSWSSTSGASSSWPPGAAGVR